MTPRPINGLDPITHPQLAIQVVDMGFYRMRAEVQSLGNRLIGTTAHHQQQKLVFSWCQVDAHNRCRLQWLSNVIQ